MEIGSPTVERTSVWICGQCGADLRVSGSRSSPTVSVPWPGPYWVDEDDGSQVAVERGEPVLLSCDTGFGVRAFVILSDAQTCPAAN